jgi:hypothetical protein
MIGNASFKVNLMGTYYMIVPFTINDKQQSGDIINIHLRRVFSGNAD